MNNDLISRSALLERFEQVQGQCKNLAEHVFFDGVAAIVAAAPAVDAEPVRHGRYDAGGDCTVCGYPMPTDDRCDAIFPSEIKYCYNCGAKMRGDVNAD